MTDEQQLIITLQAELDRLHKIYNLKCDQFTELIEINALLRLQLVNNNIEAEN